ncbi:hypothetical protein [Mycobacteroides abscessus]|uniref:hypothetical protein n=1 Tax=Mycobacteroides abscessus TaxID=36809 RepID=UPI001F43E447|nr:hypothetical protein [Mycobacteroides abscessus]
MNIEDAPLDESVALRIGVDGTVSRVPFISDETGAAALFREQIGYQVYTMTAVAGLNEMSAEDEVIAHLDTTGEAGNCEVLNPVATSLARQCGLTRAVFGTVLLTRVRVESPAPLSDGQLVRLEALGALLSPPALNLIIEVENAYSDGHTSAQMYPAQLDRLDDEDELWDELFCYTGDGHGIDEDLGSWHEVTIVESPDAPELKGLSHEYC